MVTMNMPGFDAERSLGPAEGVYLGHALAGASGAAGGGTGIARAGTTRPAPGRGSGGQPPLAQGATFVVQPLLQRAQQCTTTFSGYVTYPMKVCGPPFTRPDVGPGSFPGDLGAGTSGVSSRQALISPVATFGQVHVDLECRRCQTLNGPWFAVVVQKVDCDFRVPDSFTLSISGAPQPVVLEWKGGWENAPATVGALGNLSPLLPDCSCCPGMKECPDKTCVPNSSPCGPPTPA
jgi:hypothetical protein